MTLVSQSKASRTRPSLTEASVDDTLAKGGSLLLLKSNFLTLFKKIILEEDPVWTIVEQVDR